LSRYFADLLGVSFTVPIRRSRLRLSHHPEIVLISLLVMVVKQYFPFSKDHAPPPDQMLPHINWSKWNKIMGPVVATARYNKQNYDNITAQQVATMTEEEKMQWALHIEKGLAISKRGNQQIFSEKSKLFMCFERLTCW
jgi:hypothetical protein